MDEETLGSVRKIGTASKTESSNGETNTCSEPTHPTPASPVIKATESSSHPPDKYFATVYFQGKEQLVPINAEVDTGSSATMVTEATYGEQFSHIPLKLTSKVLHNFDESPDQGIRGSFGIDAYYGDRCTQ